MPRFVRARCSHRGIEHQIWSSINRSFPSESPALSRHLTPLFRRVVSGPLFPMATELKDTLLLPKTDFPMRAGLAQREPGRVAHWEKLDLYNQIQAKRANSAKGAFVLHDGPPFTNGDVHIGTALNKTLKDIVNRYKSMQGFRTPYVPGWDCHGLPIEQKVSKEIKEQNLTLTTAQMRAKCDEFSESWIGKQTAQFKRVGVLADWKNEYKTKAPAFEADILRTFAAFVEQGLVYRSKKPVYWSIPFETALAEAEIEYKDHVSIAIWVKFFVPKAEAEKFGLTRHRQAALPRHLDDHPLDDPRQSRDRAAPGCKICRRRHRHRAYHRRLRPARPGRDCRQDRSRSRPSGQRSPGGA
jgi:hypothetical protein